MSLGDLWKTYGQGIASVDYILSSLVLGLSIRGYLWIYHNDPVSQLFIIPLAASLPGVLYHPLRTESNYHTRHCTHYPDLKRDQGRVRALALVLYGCGMACVSLWTAILLVLFVGVAMVYAGTINKRYAFISAYYRHRF